MSLLKGYEASYIWIYDNTSVTSTPLSIGPVFRWSLTELFHD